MNKNNRPSGGPSGSQGFSGYPPTTMAKMNTGGTVQVGGATRMSPTKSGLDTMPKNRVRGGVTSAKR